MECLFINLASQPERCRQVVRNFGECGFDGWRLTRIDAVTEQEVVARLLPGHLTPSEIGCFLSHIRALEVACHHDDHTFIVEDDVLFGAETRPGIDAALRVAGERDWDFLFTDVCIPSYQTMIELFLARRSLMSSHQDSLIDLKSLPFAGSTAYVVNRRSKVRVLEFLRQITSFDVPYDLFLRHLIQRALLRASVIFPFRTSLSRFADSSQIQCGTADLSWNAYRRLMWAECSVTAATETVNRLDATHFDDETLAFAKILASMLSPNYTPK